jgi:hypothetical protein
MVREKRDHEAQNLGFSSRPFLLCGLPVKRPPAGCLLHERRNGHFLLQVTGHPSYGLPWGQDRLVPIFLATLAIRQQNRVIRFRSAAEMLDTFGLATGRNAVPASHGRLPASPWRNDLLRDRHPAQQGCGDSPGPVQFDEMYSFGPVLGPRNAPDRRWSGAAGARLGLTDKRRRKGPACPDPESESGRKDFCNSRSGPRLLAGISVS